MTDLATFHQILERYWRDVGERMTRQILDSEPIFKATWEKETMSLRLDEATLKEIGEVAAKDSLAARILEERNLLARIADCIQSDLDFGDSTGAINERLERLLCEWHGKHAICPTCGRR